MSSQLLLFTDLICLSDALVIIVIIVAIVLDGIRQKLVK